MITLTIGWKKRTIDFMGEKVVVTIRPLKTTAFNLLLPHFQAMEEQTDEAEAIKRVGDLQKVSADIFPDHLKEVTGIEVNGEPVTAKLLSEEMLLSALAVQILSHMMAITQPDEMSEKNLKSPLPGEQSAETREAV